MSTHPRIPDANLMGTGAVARELGVSESLVRRLADSGRLVALRLESGQRVMTRASVESLKAQRHARGDDAA